MKPKYLENEIKVFKFFSSGKAPCYELGYWTDVLNVVANWCQISEFNKMNVTLQSLTLM